MTLLAVLAVAVMIFTIPAASIDGDELDNYNYYVEGYVAVGGGAGKLPLEDVTVTIMDSQGYFYEDRTDENGYFKVGINSNTNLMILFTAFGYSIQTCPNTTKQEGTEYLQLRLSADFYNSITHTYTMTSTIDDMQCAFMGASDGIVRGVVSYDKGPVKNATVTLKPLEGDETQTATTDDSGRYEINCPIGMYTMVVSCKGFDDSEPTFVNITGSPTTLYITIEKSDIRKYLGLDMAHILMLIGVIVGIVLAVSAWFLSQRMNGPNRLEIVDDSASEEDDDVRYP